MALLVSAAEVATGMVINRDAMARSGFIDAAHVLPVFGEKAIQTPAELLTPVCE